MALSDCAAGLRKYLADADTESRRRTGARFYVEHYLRDDAAPKPIERCRRFISLEARVFARAFLGTSTRITLDASGEKRGSGP